MREGIDAGGRGNEVVQNAASGQVSGDQAQSCPKSLLQNIKNLPESYLRALVRCPLCFFLLMQLLVGVLVGACWRSGDLNTDFSDFLRANTGASLRYDAMQQAWQALSPPSGRRLQSGTMGYRHTLATLAYFKEDGGNLLEERSLFAILSYERKLQATAQWQFFCGNEIVSVSQAPTVAAGNGTNETETESIRTQQISCAPGESLVNYIWPSYDSPSGISVGPAERQQLVMDGSGSRFFPVEAVVSALRDGVDRLPASLGRLGRFFPKDFVVPEGGEAPHTDTLRSFFLFSQSYGPDGYYDSASAANAARKQFHGGDLHQLLRQQDEDLQEHGIRVFYSSGLLDEADIFSALFADVLLSVGGLALVFLMICLHTQSLLLSSIGALLVLECIPLGYVFFKQFSNLPKISIVNCVSTFVIIGVGSDLVFLLTDAWRQSASRATVPEEEFENPPDDSELDHYERSVLAHQRHLYRRIAWVYANAGVSSITTGLCGASSFLVNLLSVLMPLREFGLFMGLCCIFALALELVMFPMALLMRETWIFKRRLNQQEQQLEDLQGVGVVVPTDAQAQSVVPLDAVSENGDPFDPLKKRSFLVRFFAGFWSDFLERYKLYVIVCFVLSTLISLIGVATTLTVDGSPPVIFPESHNQILGRKILDRFENAVAVSVSPAEEENFICDIGAEPLRARPDTSVACGTFTAVGWCSSAENQGVMQSACSNTCGITGACFATWCPVDDAPNISKQEPGRCDCYQESAAEVELPPTVAAPGIVRFETSVVGFGKESWPMLEPHLRSAFWDLVGPPSSGFEQKSSYRPSLDTGTDTWEDNPALMQARTLAPVVQQHWRSGSLATWPGFEAPIFSVQTAPSDGSEVVASPKVIRQKCFCDGIAPCTHWSAGKQTVYHPLSGPGGSTWGSSVDILEDTAPRRLVETDACEACADEVAFDGDLLSRTNQFASSLLAPRRLQAYTPLHVVWGMKVRQLGPFDLFVETDTEQVWMRDDTFDPADPWAQRSMMRASENHPEALQVLPGTTWLQAFETWLSNRGLEYPARDFHGSSLQFLNNEGRPYANQVLRDDENMAVIVKVEFKIGVTLGSGLEMTTATRDAWESYVANRNSIASLKANKALQISSLWVNVEAQDGILRSTASTISTAILIGYVAAVLFTQDFLLSLFPMLSVLLTVLCLLFTMVGILQWPFGAVDVIALIVFLGYMFTFNLHMAQYYNHAKIPMELLRQANEKLPPAVTRERVLRERYCRVNHALTSVGQSLVCSAGTTTASAIFLLCCTLQFFVKFGAVILTVTILSILHSLMFLPSFLLLFGPTSKSCTNFGRLLKSRREEASMEHAQRPEQAGSQKDGMEGPVEEPPAPKPSSPPMPLPPLPPPCEPVEVIGSEEVDAVISPSHPSPKGVHVEGFMSQDQDESV